jgi:hypothetical protein
MSFADVLRMIRRRRTAEPAAPRAPEGDRRQESGLRVVASAANEAEAEVLRQRLAAAGIAVIFQRTIGGPEWGASGARYAYVEPADLERARGILGAAGGPSDEQSSDG